MTAALLILDSRNRKGFRLWVRWSDFGKECETIGKEYDADEILQALEAFEKERKKS